MLSTYRRILSRPGTALFCATALVARLPISMVGLGTVLLVEGATGSYGLAGAVSGVGLLANAACAVPQARLIDRFGQSRVLPVAIVLWGLGLAAAIWSVEGDRPLPLTFVVAALAGACLPSVGSCVRARWAHVLPGEADRHTAFALEAVADEAVFITGPILVTLLATAVHPVAGLAAAMTAGVTGTLFFASQRATEPPPHPPLVDRRDRAPMPWATVVPLSVASLALGTLFGAAEVTTVAFAEERGVEPLAGVLLALWAAGSLMAGVITGAVTWKRTVLQRLRLGAVAMTVAMAPLLLVDSVWVMGALLLVGGFAIAPTLIATMALAEQTVPPSRLTESMAFVQTGIVAGVAPGAVLAGLVIDAAGASPAYLVPVAGGLLALAASLAVRLPTTSRRTPNLSAA
ncbi:MFS transporter [Nocardioides litoris]|uniref:MFS transporter n=1 Tax=Nocardioides litoris TaxID=1926648 RepID=UPI0014768133|nr:MFS transporter [Nocardioides litoris]